MLGAATFGEGAPGAKPTSVRSLTGSLRIVSNNVAAAEGDCADACGMPLISNATIELDANRIRLRSHFDIRPRHTQHDTTCGSLQTRLIVAVQLPARADFRLAFLFQIIGRYFRTRTPRVQSSCFCTPTCRS